jgi:hypothetical protein
MNRFDGTSARQLVLVDDGETPLVVRREARLRSRPHLVVKDLYREIDLRRRRAQIAARHLVEDRRV